MRELSTSEILWTVTWLASLAIQQFWRKWVRKPSSLINKRIFRHFRPVMPLTQNTYSKDLNTDYSNSEDVSRRVWNKVSKDCEFEHSFMSEIRAINGQRRFQTRNLRNFFLLGQSQSSASRGQLLFKISMKKLKAIATEEDALPNYFKINHILFFISKLSAFWRKENYWLFYDCIVFSKKRNVDRDSDRKCQPYAFGQMWT